MCEPTAIAAVGAAVVGAYASNKNNKRLVAEQKKARKERPQTPTFADASVRDAGNLARRAATSGGQSSTRRSGSPLGLPGGAGKSRTLLGG